MIASSPPPPALTFHLAGAADVPFLWEMLTYAASMTPGGAPSIPAAQADPYLRTYVDGWGRAGDDLGLVACAPGASRIGAAWIRAGLIVAEPGAPELATAVVPAWRGRGVGGALIRALLARATGRFAAITLSVRARNPALRFYERLGFLRVREVTNRVGGVSWVMRHPLDATRGP